MNQLTVCGFIVNSIYDATNVTILFKPEQGLTDWIGISNIKKIRR